MGNEVSAPRHSSDDAPDEDHVPIHLEAPAIAPELEHVMTGAHYTKLTATMHGGWDHGRLSLPPPSTHPSP